MKNSKSKIERKSEGNRKKKIIISETEYGGCEVEQKTTYERIKSVGRRKENKQ